VCKLCTAAHLALQALDSVGECCQLALEVLLLLLQVSSVKLCAADRLAQLLGGAAVGRQQQSNTRVSINWVAKSCSNKGEF
jgi:hypothetical protein